MSRVKPCDADRERYGLPEWCELDLRNVTVGELTELSVRFEFNPSDWPEVLQGQLTLEQAGNPDAVPVPPAWRNSVVAWLLLRQNGLGDASIEDAADVHLFLLDYESAEPAVRGKGRSLPAKKSAPSAASTTRRSSTSTRSRRKT